MYWDLIYFGLSVITTGFVCWKGSWAARRMIALIWVIYFVFNALHGPVIPTYWYPWSNFTADLVFLTVARWYEVQTRNTDNKHWLFNYITLVLVFRVLWHGANGIYSEPYLYAVINNLLYFAMLVGVSLSCFRR